MSGLLDIATKAAEAVAAQTELWCEDAIARGPGWRVWRSDGKVRGEPGRFVYSIVHEFQLLPPGAPPPGSGTVYGPWPAAPLEFQHGTRRNDRPSPSLKY